MKVVTEILQDLEEILKRLLKHNANLKIRINYYLTSGTFLICSVFSPIMDWKKKKTKFFVIKCHDSYLMKCLHKNISQMIQYVDTCT